MDLRPQLGSKWFTMLVRGVGGGDEGVVGWEGAGWLETAMGWRRQASIVEARGGFRVVFRGHLLCSASVDSERWSEMFWKTSLKCLGRLACTASSGQ